MRRSVGYIASIRYETHGQNATQTASPQVVIKLMWADGKSGYDAFVCARTAAYASSFAHRLIPPCSFAHVALGDVVSRGTGNTDLRTMFGEFCLAGCAGNGLFDSDSWREGASLVGGYPGTQDSGRFTPAWWVEFLAMSEFIHNVFSPVGTSTRGRLSI